MNKKRINLEMHGWFREMKTSKVPNETGLYLVFGGKMREDGKSDINHLIYIGQAEDINKRLSNHEKKSDFDAELEDGEELFYYCVYLQKSQLDESEGAMIKFFNQHADIINEKCTESFSSGADLITVVLSGKVPSIIKDHTTFNVKPTKG